ncbi:PAS domain-containing protein [Spirosoma endbachense]|uniref:PAS domain-containing protein n=1 Tax=Spirosoma endbachense TaxID=2666025 RepID=A0A6P1VSF0_9BACT|nr:PAS domain-containing protein [Spirosoma endbachense]QHV94549.1 PAS domain-containing protein [Spirosoma endbachense]
MSFNYYPSYQKSAPFYPSVAYEITLLERAQHLAKRKQEAHFCQLNHTFKWAIDRQQQAAYLKSMQLGFTLILTDVSNRILWTSHNILSMTGYGSQEVIGQTPKLLQGPDTDPLVTRHIGNSIRQAQAVQVDLVNYRKNGQAYMCRLAIEPLHNKDGKLTHFLAEVKEETNS